jgi:hypothetical protein
MTTNKYYYYAESILNVPFVGLASESILVFNSL